MCVYTHAYIYIYMYIYIYIYIHIHIYVYVICMISFIHRIYAYSMHVCIYHVVINMAVFLILALHMLH